MVTITQLEHWNGAQQVQYSVTNEVGDTVSDSAIYTVLAVNDSPVITSEPTTIAYEDSDYMYQVEVEDPDNADFGYQLLSSPTEMLIDPLTGEITWLPVQSDVGDHTVILEVSDGEHSVEQEYLLQVLNVNDAPTVPVYIFPENNASGQSVPVEFSWEASSDEDGDSISYALLVGGALNDLQEIATTELFELPIFV